MTPTNLQRDCGMCGQPLAPDHVCGNYTAPTNPPTETVSDWCKCLDCYCTDLYCHECGKLIKEAQPKEKKHMTTKVEPTVEKWEKLGSLGLSETQKEAISYMHYNSVQEAKAESYKKALDDMFLEICDLAEPDEGQPSAGDLHTNMDDIHNIRTKLSTLNTKDSLKQEGVQDEK